MLIRPPCITKYSYIDWFSILYDLVCYEDLAADKVFVFCYNRFRGQSASDAEFNYLEVAKGLDLYGVDLHFAKVKNNTFMPFMI